MPKWGLISIGVALVLGLLGLYSWGNIQKSPTAVDIELAQKLQNTAQPKSSSTVSTNSAIPNDLRYLDYSKERFTATQDKKRVLFFHARWCPYCKAANSEINSNLNRIPKDVMVLKTDYDSQKELKAKYKITYQHTFVLVDKEGNAVKTWQGGGINEIVENTK